MGLNQTDQTQYQIHLDLVEALAERLETRFTGRHGAIVIGSKPQDTLSMGLLAPAYRSAEASEDDPGARAFFERTAPSTMGYDFYVDVNKAKGATLEIKAQGAVYQAITPPWPIIRDHMEQPRQSVPESEEKKNPKLRVDRFARRYSFSMERPVIISLDELFRQSRKTTPIGEGELTGLMATMSGDPDRVKKLRYGASDLRLSHVPRDEEEYRELLSDAMGPEELTLRPRLEIEAMSIPHPSDSSLVMVRVRIRNISDKPDGKAARIHEPFVFDINLETTLKGADFEEVVSEAVIDADYRYDPTSKFQGHNTNVAHSTDRNSIKFRHFPLFHQLAYEPRLLPPAAIPDFVSLAENPVPRLKNLLHEMREYRERAWGERAFDDYLSNTLLPPNANMADYIAAREKYDIEISRFEHGINVIESHDDVLAAFRLMNRTMHRSVIDTTTGKARYSAWRTFQIVYIVHVIADLAARLHANADFKHPGLAGGSKSARDIVDVLWFPTGGGKTETYLGIILWNAWWDRHRGKHFGTTAWAKFPLRFLSLQQQGRFLSVIMHANDLLRGLQESGRLPNAEPFSIGYFVGGRNTPNRWTTESLTGEEEESILRIAKQNEEKRRDWNVVPSCPVCFSPTELRPDERNARLRIICPAHDELPVYIVDLEIYRYAPTVLLGTLDKMAVMSHNYRFRRLFLGEQFRCKTHGYCSMNEKKKKPHCETAGGLDCSDAAELPGLVDVGPSLLLQDELHLLEANLGSFEAHYESFIDHYQRNLLPRVVANIVPGSTTAGPWKILGATATIKGYEDQVWKLYLRRSTRFPNPGPTRYANFYAETKTDKVRRVFAALRPNNMPTSTALKESLAEVQRFISELLEEPGRIIDLAPRAAQLSEDDRRRVLDNLVLSMSYHLARTESTSIDHWWGVNVPGIVRAAAPDLADEYNPACVTLTGDTPFYEVVSISRDLDQPATLNRGHIAHIAATKMVSHGVDISRLNVMFFNGMPRSHAEYIQSASRAGRAWPGLVISIINTKRSRDLSHYEYHDRYHDRLDLHVENVAVTRWGSQTYRKTAPGLLAALILLYLAPKRHPYKKLYKPTHLREMLDESGPYSITQDEIRQQILAAYGCKVDGLRPDGDPEGELYKREVPAEVDRILQGVLNKQQASNFFEGFADDAPMRSMRDIEGTVHIAPDLATIRYLEGRFGRAQHYTASGAPDADEDDTEPTWVDAENVVVDDEADEA